MDEAAIRRYAEIQVPRYTSYPTAVDFSNAIGPKDYASWLSRLQPGEPVSLYIHVPYCRALCHYCGCHAKLVRRDEIIADYARLLKTEIGLVGQHVSASPTGAFSPSTSLPLLSATSAKPVFRR
jgi:oxygen-independent coproporphyrinogen-3 oxidase